MLKEANVTIMVSNLEEVVQFYTDTLGLELKSRYGNQFAQVLCQGSIIAIHPAPPGAGPPTGSPNISIGFSVDDLDHAMAELRGKGVQFSEVSDDTQVRLAFFKDPNGTPLYLSQSKWR